VKEIIVANRYIKQAPGLDAWWILVIVLGAWSRDFDSR